jgi:hypothetical protein
MAIKSVIIGVLILIVWVRSYFVSDAIIRGDSTQSIELVSASGRVLIQFVHDGQPTRLRASWRLESSREPRSVAIAMPLENDLRGKLGFGFSKERFTSPAPGMRVSIVLPHWVLFLLAIPSALLWLIRNSRLRPRTGEAFVWCPRCLAEIRGSPSVCPRCRGPVAASGFEAPSLVQR